MAGYRRLILLGDIFSDLDFRRLKGQHWDFLSYIRKLSNPKRRVEVVWVEGNHDQGLSKLMSHVVGIPVYQRYVWEFEGKRHLAIHGHQFDRFVSRNYLISRIGESLYYTIQKLDSRTKSFSRFLDRLNTRWLRLSNKVATGAISYAKMGHIDRVFCGHTHVATQTSLDGVQYCNTGSWIDALATFSRKIDHESQLLLLGRKMAENVHNCENPEDEHNCERGIVEHTSENLE